MKNSKLLGLAAIVIMVGMAAQVSAHWVYSGWVSSRFSNYPTYSHMYHGSLHNRAGANASSTENMPYGGARRYVWAYSECERYASGVIFTTTSGPTWVESYTIAALCHKDYWRDFQRFGKAAVHEY